jgi:hypothetical protein
LNNSFLAHTVLGFAFLAFESLGSEKKDSLENFYLNAVPFGHFWFDEFIIFKRKNNLMQALIRL